MRVDGWVRKKTAIHIVSSGPASTDKHLRFSNIKPSLCDDNNNDEHAKFDLQLY